MLSPGSVSLPQADPRPLEHWQHAFELQQGPYQAYNEPAFRYFLEIERRRSEPSNRPLLLLLIERKPSLEDKFVIDRATAARLFATLHHSVRDTDFIGWYREGHVAGVVLTQEEDSDPGRASDVVRQRLHRVLTKMGFVDRSDCFDVRIHQLSPVATMAL